MKKTVIGVFAHREDAEKAINRLHNELSIPNEEISYLYRNTEDEIKQVQADKISSDTPGEGAKKGAKAGAIIGALAGIAATAGILPIIGPFLAAGPILTAVGITGAVGSAAAGAVGGAAVGGLVGALVNLGVGKENAQRYEDEVRAGNVLVSVHTESGGDAESILEDSGALSVETYTLKV